MENETTRVAPIKSPDSIPIQSLEWIKHENTKSQSKTDLMSILENQLKYSWRLNVAVSVDVIKTIDNCCQLIRRLSLRYKIVSPVNVSLLLNYNRFIH